MAQTRSRNEGGVDLASRIVQRLTSPPASLLTRGFNAAADFCDGMAHAGSLKRRVAQLEAQISAVDDAKEQNKLLKSQIDDLRRIQKFRDLPGKTAIPAEVSGIFIYDNRITINVGSNDGVAAGMPVVSGRGLLALIQTVESDHSQALLLTSPVTHIGAMTSRLPPPAGVLRGEGGGVLILEFNDPNAIVQNGDEVITTGFSQVIPRGIPIGRIIKVDDNPDFGTRRATVFPWATLGAASEVYVLK